METEFNKKQMQIIKMERRMSLLIEEIEVLKKENAHLKLAHKNK